MKRGLPLGDEAGHRPPAVRAGAPSWQRPADSRARVLDAAVHCVARFGVSKTTVEDVAREACLSRATLYRLFPAGRDDILRSMVSREIASFFGRLSLLLTGVEDHEERIVVAMLGASAELAAHSALTVVLEHEPERVLPHVSFVELDSVLDVASAFFAPYLAGLLELEDAHRVGEWITRLVLSYTACPEGSSPPVAEDGSVPRARPFAIRLGALPEDRVRTIVRCFVMPGVRAMSDATGRRPTSTTTSPVRA